MRAYSVSAICASHFRRALTWHSPRGEMDHSPRAKARYLGFPGTITMPDDSNLGSTQRTQSLTALIRWKFFWIYLTRFVRVSSPPPNPLRFSTPTTMASHPPTPRSGTAPLPRHVANGDTNNLDLDLDLEEDPQFTGQAGADESSQQSAYQKLGQVLRGDLSSLMRWRATKGYGPSNVSLGAYFARVEPLTESS